MALPSTSEPKPEGRHKKIHEMLDYLIQSARERGQDAAFYLSLKEHLETKKFLSECQRECIVKGMASIIGIKFYVRKKRRY